MKNNFFFYFFIFIFLNIISDHVFSNEQLNFKTTELEIVENGNLIVGKKRGTIENKNGIIISSDTFVYDKIKNIINATGNVIVENKIKNIKIYSENIVYYKNEEKLLSKGNVSANLFSKYEIISNDLYFEINNDVLYSNKKTSLRDNINKIFFKVSKFNLQFKDEIFKGEDILINTNYNLPQDEKYHFKSAIFKLSNNSFLAKDPKIFIKKNIFDDLNNDPRIMGISAEGDGQITELNKAVFTSCKQEDDKCPPWIIEADKITHDKNKKTLAYENAKVKIYDFPIFYFPYFFHPDPSVKRQSGFLKPELNNSSVLGSSLGIPYFNALSDKSDMTIKPVFFEKDIQLLQSEYRKKNLDSSFIIDFGFVNGYKSSISNNKNSLNHLFAKYNSNLQLNNFDTSELNFQIERSSNDTYLKIFESNLTKNTATPSNLNSLNSKAEIELLNDKINFTSGIELYEDLQKEKKSDKYQYILPYYRLEKNLLEDLEHGFFVFKSSGSNELVNTNNLKTKLINDLKFQSIDVYTNSGLKNNLNIDFKNLNTVAKNDEIYKSNPQSELMGLLELNSQLPLVNKNNKFYKDLLTPQASLKFNPGKMKNYNNEDRLINMENIFSSNRLGLEDTLEEGESLTIGIDYKRENLEDINKYFETKLATTLRKKNESSIPKKTTLNKKRSNVFGSVDVKNFDFFELGYDFSINDSLDKFEYNSIDLNFDFNKFSSKTSYIEQGGVIGSTNLIENSTSYDINNRNKLIFNIRRNREINLTEYYNLIYEYQNDCLIAGLKYNRNYYQDRDLKPTENLMFTITLIPLTNVDRQLSD